MSERYRILPKIIVSKNKTNQDNECSYINCCLVIQPKNYLLKTSTSCLLCLDFCTIYCNQFTNAFGHRRTTFGGRGRRNRVRFRHPLIYSDCGYARGHSKDQGLWVRHISLYRFFWGTSS